MDLEEGGHTLIFPPLSATVSWSTVGVNSALLGWKSALGDPSLDSPLRLHSAPPALSL